MPPHTWQYRGHRLRRVEWGLWRSVDDPERFLLCYRPQGRKGPVVRRWMVTVPGQITEDHLRHRVRTAHAIRIARKHDMPEALPLAQLLAEYLAALDRRNVSPKHRADAETIAAAYMAATEVRSVGQVDVVSVENYLAAKHAGGASPHTLNRHRAMLSGWFQWAARRGDLPDNPAQRVTPARIDRKLPRFPMPEDFQTAVDHAPPYVAGVWCLAAFTGLRLGSLLSLTLDSFAHDAIMVPHTKRGREWLLRFDDGCPLWAPDLSALGRRIWEARPPTTAQLRGLLDKARAAQALTWTLHGLRHAFCSWMVMMGETTADIAAWAHHASPQTTEQHYAHLRPRGRDRIESNRAIVNAMRSHTMSQVLTTPDLTP